MNDLIENEPTTAELKGRRDFLKTVGKAAIAAPAVALILSASSKPAEAVPAYCGRTCAPP